MTGLDRPVAAILPARVTDAPPASLTCRRSWRTRRGLSSARWSGRRSRRDRGRVPRLWRGWSGERARVDGEQRGDELAARVDADLGEHGSDVVANRVPGQ